MAEPPAESLENIEEGVWEITTRRTRHIIDLDKMRYMRIHDEENGNPFPYDGSWCPLSRIEIRPRVGERFLLWIDDPDSPNLAEHWRISSAVRSIRRMSEASAP